MKLQRRLIIGITGTSLLAVLTIGTVLTQVSLGELQTTLTHEIEKQLISKRDLVKGEIGSYFNFVEKQIRVKANEAFTVKAARDFSYAFKSYQKQLQNKPTDAKKTLSNYYSEHFGVEYKNQNQKEADIGAMINGLDEETIQFQFDYIANNEHPLGNKHLLMSADNGTTYANLHRKYHPSFKSFLEEFGYYDIFIADAQSGKIIYSVFKELDYATSLLTGPYKDTGIGVAFKNALNLQQGQTYLTDFQAYLPSYDSPASFIASPIYRNDKLIAVLIFQMPIDRINNIMTQGQAWKERGFGATGETFLVGPDNTLRNDSRLLLENKEQYIAALTAKGIADVDIISNKNTSISYHPIDSIGVKNALAGQAGIEQSIDYNNHEVISAFAPLKIGQMTWAIVAKMDSDEAFAPVNMLTKEIWTYTLVVVGIVILLSALIATILAKTFVAPLSKISTRLQELSSGDADLTQRLPETAVDEINDITNHFNQFVEQIREIMLSVRESALLVAQSSNELQITTSETNSHALQQKNETEQVTEGMAQFQQAIEEVTENSVLAANNTQEARDNTELNRERAQTAAQNMRTLVDEVNNSSSTIQTLQSEVTNIIDVLNVINGIADQTNLLALNAAIEAARAGEYGRGFAVVAEEVRNLASSTQQSTIEIQDRIEKLSAASTSSVESMEQASKSAEGVIDLVNAVDEAMTELSEKINVLANVNDTVASATEEQKYTCENLSGNMQRLNDTTEALSGASANIANSTDQLTTIAAKLEENVGRFKL